MVYFLRTHDKEFIKIGFTEDGRINRRLKEIQREFPRPIYLIGTIRGTLKDESRWHKVWAGLRKPRSEWFWTHPSLVDAILHELSTGFIDVGNRYFQIARQERRLFPLWRKAFLLDADDNEFCANEAFYRQFKDEFIGYVGILRNMVSRQAANVGTLRHISEFVPPTFSTVPNDDEFGGECLHSVRAYDIVYNELYNLMPSCQECFCL